MILSVAFSSWRGGSAVTLYMYLKTEVTMLFIAGALIMGWAEYRMVITAIAFGGVALLIGSRGMIDSLEQRTGLTAGTIANPNDYAAHLVLITAFLLYV